MRHLINLWLIFAGPPRAMLSKPSESTKATAAIAARITAFQAVSIKRSGTREPIRGSRSLGEQMYGEKVVVAGPGHLGLPAASLCERLETRHRVFV